MLPDRAGVEPLWKRRGFVPRVRWWGALVHALGIEKVSTVGSLDS